MLDMKRVFGFAVAVVLSMVLTGPALRADPLMPDTHWTYKNVNGRELRMDVFLPEGYASGENFPVFVVFHGGSWQTGEPSWHYPDCAYWRSRGMIAVSVD